ncbi:MAG: hypothetical protein HKN28_07700 [Alphaproteobacteria bacterium]|nr:hypothetical protein [Alphaproteobacteria bacterium]
MTHEQNDGLAAEYVLGTLDGDERRQFAAALASDPELQRLVEEWQQRLQALESGAAEVTPSAGLWDRIEAALEGDSAGLANSVTLHDGDGEWQQLAAGVEKKVLYFDQAARSESFLLRIAPGTSLPSHDHSSAEECLVIDGTFDIGDIHLKAGDFHAIDGNTTHPDCYSEHGATLYIRGEIREAHG